MTHQSRLRSVLVSVLATLCAVGLVATGGLASASGAASPSGAPGGSCIVGCGYTLAASDGGVFAFGDASFHGSAGSAHLNRPVVGSASTPDGGGYWLVASDGGVFAYGNANFYGSTGDITLAKPIVGIAATPDGKGYWLVASDGGVFSFGDAVYYGGATQRGRGGAIVAIAATHTGLGYWLVTADGAVFAYGDAKTHGDPDLSGLTLTKPIVGIQGTPSDGGYWLVASDGGVFNYGDAAFYGSTGGITLNKPVVGLSATPDGTGYWLVASDGGVFNFGAARFYGSLGGITLNGPVVSINGSLVNSGPQGGPPIHPTLDLTTAVNPVATTRKTTLTATLSVPHGAPTPTGTISFKAGSDTLCTVPITNSLTVTCTVALPAGQYDISAVYSGDSQVAATVSLPISQVAEPASVFTTVAGAPAGYQGDGGAATISALSSPSGITVANGVEYFSDNNAVRAVDLTTGLISTIAGNGTNMSSGDGGPATSAGLQGPWGLAVAPNGVLYISEFYSAVIRAVNLTNATINNVGGSGVNLGAGDITTVAGTFQAVGYSGDSGPATSAHLGFPQGLAVSPNGHTLYVADGNNGGGPYGNNAVRAIDLGTGTITTVIGGGSDASSCTGVLSGLSSLNNPGGVAISSDGLTLYVADTCDNQIKAVTLSSSAVSVVAGTGTAGHSGYGGQATSATLGYPTNVAVSPDGSVLYIADQNNSAVRAVNLGTGVITNFAGTGTTGTTNDGDGGLATSANLGSPRAVAASGTSVYIADANAADVRVVDTTTGIISTNAGVLQVPGYVGNGGPAKNAILSQPAGIAFFGSTEYIGDSYDGAIRKVDLNTQIISTLAITGVNTQNIQPSGLAVSLDGTTLYVADPRNNRVLSVDSTTGAATTIANSSTLGSASMSGPVDLVLSPDGTTLYVADKDNNEVFSIVLGPNTTTAIMTNASDPTSCYMEPNGVTISPDGSTLYVSNRNCGDVLAYDISNQAISVFAGTGAGGHTGDNGPANLATLSGPAGLTITPDGSTMYIADTGNQVIRKIDLTTNTITTVAGNGSMGYSGDNGSAISAEFTNPSIVATFGTTLYIADTGNSVIRSVTPLP